MDKIKLNTDYLKSNLEYEEDLTQFLQSEISTLDEYLEFILESKIDELIINRRKISVIGDKDYCPSYYYKAGLERGTSIYYDNIHCVTRELKELKDKEGIEEKKYNWIEWNIQCENISYRDSFHITITPFLFSINSFSSEKRQNNSDKYEQEVINIFTDELFQKWNDKLEKIVINKKRDKLKNILDDSYKVLGIEREVRLKTILG